MLLLVFVWLQKTLTRSLIYTAFMEETFSSTQGWEMSIPSANQQFPQCENQSLLGSFGYTSWIMKNINLPPHHTVHIKFLLWRVGNWNNEKFILFYDQLIGFEEIFTQNGIKVCDGKTATEQEIQISLSHEFQSILVILKGYLSRGANNKWWGVRNFQIEVDECIPGCKQCTQSDQRWECLQWDQVHSTINSIQLQQLNFEGWMIQESNNYIIKSNLSPISMFGGTDLLNNNWEIFVNFELPIHNQIKIKFRLTFINFLDDEYFYLKIDQQELLKDNHNLLEEYQQNSNPTITYNFKTYELIFEHQSYSMEIRLFKDNLNQGALGINDFMIFVKTQGYCGDGFKSQEEECDDNNFYPFDGCFNCQYQCIENCKFCHQGICLECEDDYNLQELQQKCVFILKTQYNEVTQINICKRCSDSCSNQCSYCVKGECQCENNQNQILNQNCDDFRQRNAFSQALQDFQEYKCHACELDCAEFCTECIQGYCFSCQPKFYLFEYECLPICGDGDAQYFLEIQYFSQIEYPPSLKAQFNQNIYNQYYNNLVDNQITIKLQKPKNRQFNLFIFG